MLFSAVPALRGQLAPVVRPRGVVNAFTQEPAPSTVAPGGLVWINGFNFGTVDDTKVLVNGNAAKVLSVTVSRIVTLVPADAAPGIAEVVVERGGGRSKPARVLIQPGPSVRTSGDSGYGEAAGAVSGTSVTLSATGLTRSEEVLTAHVGGLPATAEAAASEDRPGESDLKLVLPDSWQAGDMVSLRVGGRTANRVTLGKAASAAVSFIPLPAGAPELRSLTASDLRGGYLIASAARDDQGCSPSWLFDIRKAEATPIGFCLASGNQNDAAPASAETEGSGLASLIGPPEGQAPAGVSSKVALFHPERADPITVQLPSAASAVSAVGGEGISVVLGGDPPRRISIDTRTGEIREGDAMPGAGIPGGGGAVPAGGAGGPNAAVDLGNGLNKVLSSPASSTDGSTGMVVGDNAENPTRMAFAIVTRQSGTISIPFPGDWLALIGPQAAAAGGAPGGAPGGVSLRVTVAAHPGTGEFYVIGRNAANTKHALIAFARGEGYPKVTQFPDGWFAAACVSRVPVYTFQLSPQLAVPLTSAVETTVKTSCQARAFAIADPGAAQASLLSMPAQTPLELAASSGSMNDFVYGGDAASADTLVVLDGALASVSAISVPSGVTSFSGLTQIPAMNSLLAAATSRTQGDAGFVLFDLDKAEARRLAMPDGFSSASTVGVFTVTRKLVAKGTRSDNSGSQFVVYDLVSGDSAVVANPDGVAWAGSLPLQSGTLPGGGTPGAPGGGAPGLPGGGLPGGGVPGGGVPGGGQPGADPQAGAGGLQQANTKANTVSAVCFDANRKQVGVMVVRVP